MKSEFSELKIDLPDLKTQKTIVKLSELQRKEQRLLETIRLKRSFLLQAACLKAAGKKDKH